MILTEIHIKELGSRESVIRQKWLKKKKAVESTIDI